jgi:cation diffusion facilitator family transporter
MTGTVREQHEQRRVAATSMAAACALIALKLVAGVVSGSLGLIAEALHSVADFIAAALTYVAIRVAQRPPDRSHPWGHGRAENLAALFESLMLMGALTWIVVLSTRRLFIGHPDVNVDVWTFVVMGVVIVVDIWRTISSSRAAHKFQNAALASNALHFLGDLTGSIAVLVGLVCVALGFPAGDALAALVVAVIVGVNAARLLWDNSQVLMDMSSESAERTATRAIANLDLPITLKRLRIRRSSGSYLADVVIGVQATDHVAQGHALADAVESAVHDALPDSDVVVHVEPDEAGRSLRERITAATLTHTGIYEVHNVRVLLLDGAPEASLHVKVRSDMRLDSAHDLADRIERSIRQDVPGITHVDVHIEPIHSEASVSSHVDDAELGDAVAAAVLAETSFPAAHVRIRDTDARLTAYVTILADAAMSLHDAHEVASQVEKRICRDVPKIHDVVVHTEPAPASAATDDGDAERAR